MVQYFKKYKAFLLFLAKFLGSYLVLIFLYQIFLDNVIDTQFNVDAFTAIVSNQTKMILELWGYDVTLVRHQTEAAVRIILFEKPIVRIVEGCNAMSIMILFVAFIVAFSATFLRTFLYILSGIVVIHILNILRISTLIVGMLHYREYEDLMHDVIFPLFIYGVVFGLWILWVNKFSKNERYINSK